MTATLQIIMSVVGVGVSIMAALVAVAWHLRGRLDSVERRLDNLQGHMETRIWEVENRMETRFQAVENLMETRFGEVESRFERVENRMDDFGAGIRSLNHQVASVVGLIPTVFAFLHRGRVITEEEYRESVGQFINRISQGSESLVEHLSRSMNPLTSTEAQRFKELVSKARRGEFFTRKEAVEYHQLIGKVQAEHPDDPRIWPLVALGEFLMGLYRGSKQDDTQETSPQ